MTMPPLPTLEEVHAVYQQDEAAVQALFQQGLAVAASLADRIQVRITERTHASDH